MRSKVPGSLGSPSRDRCWSWSGPLPARPWFLCPETSSQLAHRVALKGSSWPWHCPRYLNCQNSTAPTFITSSPRVRAHSPSGGPSSLPNPHRLSQRPCTGSIPTLHTVWLRPPCLHPHLWPGIPQPYHRVDAAGGQEAVAGVRLQAVDNGLVPLEHAD